MSLDVRTALRRWLEERSTVFSGAAITAEFHMEGPSTGTTIDFDFPRGVGQVCAWPHGSAETTIGTLESPPTTHTFEFSEIGEFITILQDFETRLLDASRPT